MRFDVVTLFPEAFEGFLKIGLVGRALAEGRAAVHLCNLRDFGIGRHRSVDDTPYGGGSGMIMRVDVVVAAIESCEAQAPQGFHRVLLTPQGAPFTQKKAQELAERQAIMLVCGRYEGFDDRVRSHVSEELSLGDFVMTGGEVAAMAVIDASTRLLPGVLGNEASIVEESHSPSTGGLLEYPQFTRPAAFRGVAVPDVLQRGNHAEIARWRRDEAMRRTAERRPDLWRQFSTGREGS